jgi:hypothetical protein
MERAHVEMIEVRVGKKQDVDLGEVANGQCSRGQAFGSECKSGQPDSDPRKQNRIRENADGREARAGIGVWMSFYNHRRPHQAMSNQMPMEVWRAGIIEAAARAVDMPLRLDNANALPTYPQQQNQQAA